ncbi:MAG TPA: DUF3267 domain-containing protein [Calditerricola sp.]
MKEDRTISPWVAVIAGLVAASAVAVPLFCWFTALWGRETFWWGMGLLVQNTGTLVLVLVVSVVFHELLHAVGWVRWGKAPWRAIRFGVHWLTLSPYAHLTVPIPARPYRWGAVLPGLVLGLFPALAACITGNGALFAYGLVMILAAGGDLVVLVLLSRVPRDWLVQDSAHRVGAVVWPR